MRTSTHHEVVGPGSRCSVPMWNPGECFCDAPAHGKPLKARMYRDQDGVFYREVRRFDGYVPALACPAHGGPSVEYGMDGDSHYARLNDFVNLQESPAGFGDSQDEALADLVRQLSEAPQLARSQEE